MSERRRSQTSAEANSNPRRYGPRPYSVIVVHGGPGAAGEMAPVAVRLARRTGVLEPLQTRDTVAGQLAELKGHVEDGADGPVAVIGYSWGAWLAYLLAAYHPNLVSRLILVSSGPFEEHYARQIAQARSARMSADDNARVQQLLAHLQDPRCQNKDALFTEFGEIFERVDAYHPILSNRSDIQGSFAIYQRVWEEASQLRRSGELLALGTRIVCPVVALHGKHDPHPAVGVQEPLQRVLREFRFILLDRCGHTPWHEVEAEETFYQLLENELPAG